MSKKQSTAEKVEQHEVDAPVVEAMNSAPQPASGDVPTPTAPAIVGVYDKPRRSIDLDLIRESSTNPRKDYGDLSDLVESIKRHGVMQPVLVRPVTTGLVEARADFELVYGHRRFRAAKEAGLTEIPAEVRELSDVEVLEVQLVENAKRKDVNALEEAEAYKRLRDEHGLTAEEIAVRVGKNKASVYARLKLCSLVDEGAKKALIAGEIDASTALLIARLDPLDQRKVAPRILKGQDDAWEAKQGRDNGPMSYREAHEFLTEGNAPASLLRPAEAPFNAGDASLVPAAGACTKCPKRIDDDGVTVVGQKIHPADLCDDSSCWATKVVADRDRKLEPAAKKGLRVLSTTEDAKFVDEWGRWYPKNAGYALHDATLEYEDTGSYSNRAKWNELLDQAFAKANKAKDADPEENRAEFAKVIVATIDPETSKPVQLVEKKAALKLIRANGLLAKPKKKGATGSSSTPSAPKPKASSAEDVVRAKAQAAVKATFDDLLATAVKTSPASDTKLLRLVAATMLRADGVGDAVDWKALGIDRPSYKVDQEAALKLFAGVNVNTLRLIVAKFCLDALGQHLDEEVDIDFSNDELALPGTWHQLGELFGFDVAALEEKTIKGVQVEIKQARFRANFEKKAGCEKGSWNARGHWITKNHAAIPSETSGDGVTWIPIAQYNRDPKKAIASADVLLKRPATTKPSKSTAAPFKKIAAEGRKAVAKIKKASAKPKSSGSSKKSAAKK